MHKYPDRKILVSLLALALIAGVTSSYLNTRLRTDETGQSAAAIQAVSLPTVTPPKPVTLGFVGDIMLDRTVRSIVEKKFSGDYSRLFAKASFLKEPDIMFANLEGPISDKGRNLGSTYSFRMDPKALVAIKESGIDVVSFTNNHVGDYGTAAFTDSITRLRDANIAVCGAGMNKAEAMTPAVIEQNGLRVGFLCFSDVGPNALAATEDTPGILIASDPDFENVIRTAASEVNALVVSFHWGEEYEPLHNDRQEQLAQAAIESGASFVVGHHPHVAEDISEYSGAPIVYSLGNFIFDQYFSKETMEGAFVTATFDGKKFKNVVEHAIAYDKNSVVSLK